MTDIEQKISWHAFFHTGYIHGAVQGHRKAVFTAAVQSLDGAKPNTNPKTVPNPNTNPTILLTNRTTMRGLQ